jgi:hypothetical protein
VEVTNSSTCYTYIFGQETDGSSYVLFPYTPKHSPYCGITGTRLFPKDHSLQADETGNKDYIAVVITKQPIDYNVVNQEISKLRTGALPAKLSAVLGNRMIEGVNFVENSGNVAFRTNVTSDAVVGFVIEIDKQ